jgi:hypothetical protein
MAAKKTLFQLVLWGMFISLAIAGPVQSQDITPAQNQEYIDAKDALEAARKAKAERYAAETLKKSGEFLSQADTARSAKDGSRFTQASRLARVYAELAEATAQLKRDEEDLAATNEEIRKIKADIERLNKN